MRHAAKMPSDEETGSYWDAARFDANDRIEALEDAISNSFLPWAMHKIEGDQFSASIRERRFNGCRLIRCDCDPFSGFRKTRELANTEDRYLSILHVLSGTELLEIDGTEVILNAGDVVLWDSERQMSFSVSDPLKKVTLMMPETQMRHVFPHVDDFVGVPIDGRRGAGALFANHLQTLEREIWTMGSNELDGVLRGTLELLANAYGGTETMALRSMKSVTMERIRQFVLENLSDCELSPTRIAAAHRISIRYLHWLFEDSDASVSEWIRNQRIERCKADLINPQYRHHSITDIAGRWGFNDVSHFGKVFRKTVGVSPREFRSETLVANNQ